MLLSGDLDYGALDEFAGFPPLVAALGRHHKKEMQPQHMRNVAQEEPARRQPGPSFGLRCADVMTTDVAVLGTGETVVAAARKMRELNVGFLPVCSSDRRLLGVLTDRDLTLRVIAEEQPLQSVVQDVMSPDPIACPASAELELAEGLMRAHRKVRIACVDDDGRLVGVVSLADIARYTSSERAGDLLAELVAREVPAPGGGRLPTMPLRPSRL